MAAGLLLEVSGALRLAKRYRTALRAHLALIADPCPPLLEQQLQELGVAVAHRQKGESVAQALLRGRPEIVILRSSLLQEMELKEAAEGLAPLKIVVRAGAGVDNIAVSSLLSRGVLVANAAGANAIAVAELTLAHLLNLDRRLSDQVESLRRGEWRRLDFAEGAMGLYGRTLAVLGAGYIGREVIRRAVAFGMKVKAWSRSMSTEAAKELQCTLCSSPEEAVDGAHALTVHLPLTPETKGLVSSALLQRMRPAALVVNMSRGGVVDEAALLEAIELRGFKAGLDVFEHEPGAGDVVFGDESIKRCVSVYGTHHTGARTQQAAEAVEEAVVRAVEAYLRGEPVPGLVTG